MPKSQLGGDGLLVKTVRENGSKLCTRRDEGRKRTASIDTAQGGRVSSVFAETVGYFMTFYV
jgi:hypothetical protein